MAFVRIRRFKTPIVLAIMIIIAFYHFRSLSEQQPSPIDNFKHDSLPVAFDKSPAPALPVDDVPASIPPKIASIDRPKLHTPPTAAPQKPFSSTEDKTDKENASEEDAGASEEEDSPALQNPSGNPPPKPALKASAKPSAKAIGSDENVAEPKPSSAPKVLPKPREHWKTEPVHFPLPPESIIPLPTGKPVDIPQIQASFAPEGAATKTKRLARQKAVKEAFKISWGVYKVEAWGHDEVLPVSGGFRDPFGGWGASLVDALDTLWIMDLKDEFETAVKQVAKIDFLTTTMSSIPIFETTIRYVGGLIAAYDISEHKYPILLQKAIEIADFVYGSFDTQNRMPELHYRWKERQRQTPANGGANMVMSEIGSLSLEFTRLAQITGNETYYDAIARITNALDEYQMKTSSPGMWPTLADATKCKPQETKPEVDKEVEDMLSGTTPSKSGSEEAPKKASTKAEAVGPAVQNGAADLEVDGKRYDPVKRDLKDGTSEETASTSDKTDESDTASEATGRKSTARGEKSVNDSANDISTNICEAQVTKGWGRRTEEYGLGALIDSLYEYLLKEYLLLGGVGAAGEQYKRLYTSSMEKVTQKLLFRPEVLGDPDVLLSGQYKVGPDGDVLNSQSSHLQCFAGGMFAMGSRVFSNQGDLKTGSKLTDGCVWAYGAMRSGIMPEYFKVNKCPDKDNCKFNETEWLLSLVPPGWEPDQSEMPFTGGRGKFEVEQPTPTEKKPKIESKSKIAEVANAEKAIPTAQTVVDDMEESSLRSADSDVTPKDELKEPEKEQSAPIVKGDVDAKIEEPRPKPLSAAAIKNQVDDNIEVPSRKEKSVTTDDEVDEAAKPRKKPKVKSADEEDEDSDEPAPKKPAGEQRPTYKAVRMAKSHSRAEEEANTRPKAKPKRRKKKKPTHVLEDEVEWDEPEEHEYITGDTLEENDEEDEDEEDEEIEDENGFLLRKRDVPTTLKKRGSPERIIEGRSSHGYSNKLEWAKTKVKDQNLPPGFRDVSDARYILRPEAIESVWYMYRITGDTEWQEKGWKMFQAVNSNTLSELAHSAIEDVRKKKDDMGFNFRDEMESFWFGETLKYYYLLFSEPDLVSLDEWVLNTEAHPFKRPTHGASSTKKTKTVLTDDDDDE